jgi:coiled-coil domain-containing protein 55
MKLSFSLNKPKQPASTPSIGPSAAFSSENDDDRIDAAPTSSFADRNTAGNKKLLAHGIESFRDKRKRIEAEKMEEVFDYDAAWDSIQAERQRQKEAKDSETRERKVGFHTCSLLTFTLLTEFIISQNISMASCPPLQHGS